MANASYSQTSFLGGRWSANAQGRTVDPNYKAAMNVCTNGYPLEAGAWTRRQGFRRLAHTRHGNPAVLRTFDFTITQPYEIEFTNLAARMFAGLGLVQEVDGTLNVSTISTDSPAKVFLVQPIPAAWSAGDTVMFNVNSVPCSSKQICGRQFTIGTINTAANYITLLDPITGANINGATIAYVFSNNIDTIFKVFEMVTPYATADLQTLRTVQDQTTVLVLHPSYQQRVIAAAANPQPFAIAKQDFLDGPYLTTNATSTTLALSALTGSVTVTASSINGINTNTGFQTTDVGRVIRFQSGPAAWSNGATYAKGAIVLGSDNNIYQSVSGGNIGHDPTTDSGTNWQITSQIATWCWLKITARTDTTHVTATIMDSTQVTDPNCLSASPTATTATTVWALGAFSDTTGWPSCGVYHEGRLWLGSQAGNTFYTSFSNDHFVFSPTAADGTVSDANGMTEQLNYNDVNAFFWMLSTDQGVVMGTQAGEWLIFSSAMNDAITPTTIDSRRVSSYGCANEEPVLASVTVFTQREKRRLLAHAPLTGTKFFADNLNELADDITATGVAEIRWQQTPNLTVWARRIDGTLIGSTFQKMPLYSAYQSKNGSFTAWHQHAHGQGRIFTSIATGPSYDGLSDALYAVTNNTNQSASDYNVYQIEVLTPLFDDSQADWAAFFVDGGGTPCCGTQRAIANGDSFDGLQFYGMGNLVGQTIQPVLGALDLGDRVVASDGSISVPYNSDPENAFTLAFWQAFNGGSYGPQAGTISYTTIIALPATPIGADTINAYADTAADPGYTNDIALLDGTNDKIYLGAEGSMYSSPVAQLRRFGGTTGNDELTHTLDQVYATLGIAAWSAIPTYTAGQRVQASDGHFYVANASNTNQNPAGGANVNWNNAIIVATNARLLGGDGKLYVSVEGGNTCPIIQVDATALTANWIFGTTSATTGPSSSAGLEASSGFAQVNNRYLFSASTNNTEVAVLDTTGPTYVGRQTIDEVTPTVCAGIGVCYGLGIPTIGGGTTSPFGIYTYETDGTTVYKYKAGTIAPSAVDATWTHFTQICGPAYDARDGNILVGVTTADAVTHQCYIIKVNPHTGAIVWTCALTSLNALPVNTEEMNHVSIPNYRYCMVNGSSSTVYEVHTDTGTLVTYAWNTGLSPSGGQQYDDISASVTFFGTFTSGQAGPAVTEIGTYLTAHPGTFTSKWGRIYLGGTTLGRSAPSTVQYTVPISTGFTYNSDGQLLRPDFGQDAGARTGPAGGKIRRNHWYGALFHRARRVSIGFDFSHLDPITFKDNGGTALAAPTLFSGVQSDTMIDDYSFDGMIAWRISRPYPCIVASVHGYIKTQDK